VRFFIRTSDNVQPKMMLESNNLLCYCKGRILLKDGRMGTLTNVTLVTGFVNPESR